MLRGAQTQTLTSGKLKPHHNSSLVMTHSCRGRKHKYMSDYLSTHIVYAVLQYAYKCIDKKRSVFSISIKCPLADLISGWLSLS